MNKIVFYRQKINITQTELSEKAGLSIRTIQRAESGIVPKGHTLKSLAESLEIDVEKLKENSEVIDAENEIYKIQNIKIINISALLFLIIPFGNLFFPFLIWSKKDKEFKANLIGHEILNIQILWSLLLTVFLILSPFVQKFLSLKFSLLLTVFIIFALANSTIILINAQSINRHHKLRITVPFQIF